MEKQTILTALAELEKSAPKRKFSQSYDLILNLKALNLKKPEHQIDVFTALPVPPRPRKVCAIVGPELLEQARGVCDLVISKDDFPKYEDKRAIKKLAGTYDWFIAQANLMPEIAKRFGRFLGPRGKMPNPKVGCVVPPNANLKPLVEKLKRTILLTTKKGLSVKCIIGKQGMPAEQVADNASAAYRALVTELPEREQNIKSVMLKLTMSPAVKIEGGNT